MFPRKLAPAGLSLALLCVLALPSTAGEFTFTSIVSSSSPTYKSFSAPSINSLGRVAFYADLDSGASGIYSATSFSITPIAVSSDGLYGSFAGAGDAPALNTDGTVVFRAVRASDSAQGIFAGNGTTTTAIATTAFSSYASFGLAPSINSAGEVAFYAGLFSGGAGIFTSNGVVTTTIAREFNLDFGGFGGAPRINDSGVVAFFATRDSNGVEIYTGNGTIFTPIVIAPAGGNPYSDLYYSPSLNNAGTVAFKSALGAGNTGVETGNGGSITDVALSTGPSFGGLSDNVAINNFGTVAFSGGLDTGGFGLFNGPNAVSDLVLHSGDALFGSTLDGLLLGPGSINDNGQIAFRYTLANGQSGIAVATPTPEPGACLLLGIGAVSIFGRRRRSARS